MKAGEKITIDNHVLVVGTTPDYVKKIYRTSPGRAVFLMREQFIADRVLSDIPAGNMIFAPFDDFEKVFSAVRTYFSSFAAEPVGIACFDCDALIVAARLAECFTKPFADAKTVNRCRNKFLVKCNWLDAGIMTPRGIIADTFIKARSFLEKYPEGVVLKPIAGGGSELVFLCRNEKELMEAVNILIKELPHRRAKDLFRADTLESPGEHEKMGYDSWIVEAYIPGPEFSCDFLLQDGAVRIVRVTGKVKAPDQTFGTILAYTYPAPLPGQVSETHLESALNKAVTVLGFTRGHFMADFIIKDAMIFLVELSPRPGGDSIPDLVETATGTNLLELHLDFVSGEYPALPVSNGRSYASVNLFAPEEGVVEDIDASLLYQHAGVRKVVIQKNQGERIVFPPADYESRYLGYCIVEADDAMDLQSHFFFLNDLVRVSLSKRHEPYEMFCD